MFCLLLSGLCFTAANRKLRHLGGTWAWRYVLDAHGNTWLVLKLYPDITDEKTMQVINAGTRFQGRMTAQGNVLLADEEQVGVWKRPCYAINLVHPGQAATATRTSRSAATAVMRQPPQVQPR